MFARIGTIFSSKFQSNVEAIDGSYSKIWLNINRFALNHCFNNLSFDSFIGLNKLDIVNAPLFLSKQHLLFPNSRQILHLFLLLNLLLFLFIFFSICLFLQFLHFLLLHLPLFNLFSRFFISYSFLFSAISLTL
jgi:hypothetical protein